MKKILSIFALLCTILPASAHDFSSKFADGQVLYFNIIDAEKNRVELTYPGSIVNGGNQFVGELNVPRTVTYGNKTYVVSAIGKKAFSGATRLTSVILPTGITQIGDFAFEKCFSLRKIMFPGNEVKFGSGTFYRCNNISSVTLGSDWTKVNLQMFRWSTNLKEINIPAKTMRVMNLKSLKGLQKITVDATNPNYQAINGVLYNKSGNKLLSCPRAYYGKLSIAYGTTTVAWGAFSLCNNITQVVIPSTVTILSYKEFAHIKSLNNIIMKAITPPSTAELKGEKVFLLQVAKPTVQLIVDEKYYKNYKKVLTSVSGDYKDIASNQPSYVDQSKELIPFHVAAGETITTDNLVSEKDLSIY